MISRLVKKTSVKNRVSLIIAVILLFQAIGLPSTAKAQKYPVELSRSEMTDTNMKSDAGSIDIEHDHASLILPILPFESFMLLIYLKEDQKNISYKDFPDNVTIDGLTTTVPLSDFPDKLVNSTRGALLVLPIGDVNWVIRRDDIIATDHKEVDSQDHAFMNQILYRPKSSEKSKWFYGVSHLGGIAKDSYWPLLGYTYKGDVVRVNMVLPSYFILQFKLGEHGYVLIDETVTSESYRLTEKAPWNNAYLSQLNLTSRIEAGIRFGDFELGLSYGLTNIHSLTFSDSDHNELHKWELDADTITSLQFQWNL